MSSREELYAKFGITAEAAQLLETELGTILLCLTGVEKKWYTKPNKEEASQFLLSLEKHTLGQILKKLNKYGIVEGDLSTIFNQALKTRNMLFHGFYERHNFEIQTDKGRGKMIMDLENMHVELFNAWRIADKISSVITSSPDFDKSDYR